MSAIKRMLRMSSRQRGTCQFAPPLSSEKGVEPDLVLPVPPSEWSVKRRTREPGKGFSNEQHTRQDCCDMRSGRSTGSCNSCVYPSRRRTERRICCWSRSRSVRRCRVRRWIWVSRLRLRLLRRTSLRLRVLWRLPSTLQAPQLPSLVSVDGNWHSTC